MDGNVMPIVVGVDGSADSQRAVRWAVEEASGSGTPLLLLHSISRPLETSTAAPIVEARARGEGILAQARALVGDFPEVSVSARRMEGLGLMPAAALAEASEQASVVVVGARGHGGFTGLLLGSVSQHAARHAACPVIAVRAPADVRSQRVVVGVDGSASAQQALDFACEHAGRRGGEVTAVLGWRGPTLHGLGVVVPVTEDARQQQQQQRHQAQLEEWLAPTRSRFPDVQLEAEAIPGHAARLLIDASEHAALVVVGSRGRGAFAGLLLGSVGQSVLDHARCPVAVVR